MLSPVTTTQFMEPVRPTMILPPTVLGVFRLFFTTTLVATIVEQTNLYARQVLGDPAERRWTDITADDIWAFLGFALLMGINRLPQLHLYWSKLPEYHYRPVAERISRDRFFAILRFMHFRDNTTQPPSSSPPDPTRDGR